MFSIAGNIVYFTSDTPGSYATMFGPDGKPLVFREDACVFNNDAFSFKWAFEYRGQFGDGKRFVFASSVHGVVGKMFGYGIVISDVDLTVVRDAEGRPVRAEIADVPAYAPPSAKRKLPPPSLERIVSIVPDGSPLLYPRVSIVTCTYNRAGMLIECIDSMRKQTDDSWEHLICDNGSTDPEVRRVLAMAVRTDPRVRVFRRSANVDQPARFWNELLDKVRGDYVGFLDDDNTKMPEFIEVLSNVLDDDATVDMVTCGCAVFDKDGSRCDNHLNMETSSERVERQNTVDTGCFLIRREALERIGYFPLNIRTNEDWLMIRRVVAASLCMVHLPDVLATYRSHTGQRMEYCAELGSEKDKSVVESAMWGPIYGVRVHYARLDRLTMSQRDVVEGVLGGVGAIPWAEDGSDLALILMPFQIDLDEIRAIASAYRSVVLVHSEDPFALHTNIERVRAATEVCDDVWVCSNDTTCEEEYREIVGEKLIVCPSLSIDHRVFDEESPCSMADRLLDVLLVGYAYPGRIKFMREFFEHFGTSRTMRIVGDGWSAAGFGTFSTLPFTDTAPYYSCTRAVVCIHRGHGDCVDGPHEPKLAQRGYVEGMGGARVFVDCSRPDHPFDPGEVEWFDGPRDLADKLQAYLTLPHVEQARLAEPLRVRARKDFTYRTRIARVINAIRSPRYGAVIP